MKNKIKLGGLFYPTKDGDRDIPFDSLFIPYIYREIYMDGVYIDVLNGRKDMVIMDVGANIGVTVQHFQNYAKKVCAIEPLNAHYEALKKNVEFNEWKNVETFKMAITGKDGEVTMHPLESNMTCTSYTNDYGQGGEVVEGQTFKTFFEKNNIEQVDFCKFDVEGSENDILYSEGFTSVADKIKAIEIEFHHPDWRQLVEHLIKLGFKARQYQCSAIVVLFVR
jgi:FkbM family methyltransferase